MWEAFSRDGVSGYLIKRGWSLGAARKAPIVYGGIGMTLLIPTIFTTNLYLIAFLFAVVTFTYAGFTTMANVLPSDLFGSESVASVSGLSGTGAGIGTIVAFKLIGYVSDARQGDGHALLRSHRDPGGNGSAHRDDSGVAAASQYRSDGAGPGAPDLKVWLHSWSRC